MFAFLMVDRLEHWNDGAGGEAWGVKGWIGNDDHRLWLRSEGEREGEKRADADLEVLYGRPVARWWDVQAGVRRICTRGALDTVTVLAPTLLIEGAAEAAATAVPPVLRALTVSASTITGQTARAAGAQVLRGAQMPAIGFVNEEDARRLYVWLKAIADKPLQPYAP